MGHDVTPNISTNKLMVNKKASDKEVTHKALLWLQLVNVEGSVSTEKSFPCLVLTLQNIYG